MFFLFFSLELIFLTRVLIDLVKVNAPECHGRRKLLLDQEHHIG